MRELLTHEEVVAEINAEIEREGITVKEFARRCGISKQYLHHIRAGAMKPNERVGYEEVSMFRRITKKRQKLINERARAKVSNGAK